MAEITITTDNFSDEVFGAGMPVLLDFWATWCGPCQMVAPIVKELAEELDGKVKVGKVNVDEQPELAEAFRIESIPTLVVLVDGAVTNMCVGYQPKEKIKEMLGL